MLQYQLIPYDWLKSEFITVIFRIQLIVHCDCDIFDHLMTSKWISNEQSSVFTKNAPLIMKYTGQWGVYKILLPPL